MDTMGTSLNLSMEWDPESRRRLENKLKARNSRVGQQFAFSAKPVEDFCFWYGGQVAHTAAKRAPHDTGKLGQSIGVRWEGEAVTVYTRSHYGGFVDMGTRPHWPPVKALEGWARRHGIPAFLVARAIARKGTKETKFLRGAWDETARRELAPGMRRLVDQVQVNWGRY